MADVFTPELTFGPYKSGIMTPTAPGLPYRTIVNQGLGPELVLNGTFVDSTSWNAGVGWVNSNGANGTAASAFDWQTNSIIAGRTYQITFTVTGYSAGSVKAYVGATPAFTADRSANGTYTENVLATTNTELGLLGTGFTGTVSSLSIKEVL